MLSQQPLFRRVVFVDWHGVMSRDPFWSSIRNSPRHPLRSRLEAVITHALSDHEQSARWMLGQLSTKDIVSDIDQDTPQRYLPDFLMRRVARDCARMRVDTGIVAALTELRASATVVLATDNMDCFAQVFRDYAAPDVRRPRASQPTLANQVTLFDDLLCSSEIGAMKASDPVGFFGSWLRDAGLGFADAILIDDRGDNCEAFRRCGGRAVQWRIGDSPAIVLDQISLWAA